MQQEFRIATFNAFNLAPAGARLYDNLEPSTPAEFEEKLDWTARQLDRMDADLIAFQEIFSQSVLRAVLARTERYRHAFHAGIDPDPRAERLTPSVALVSRLPFAGTPQTRAAFPPELGPPGSPSSFARAPLCVPVDLGGTIVEVVVVHLKSRRPDYRNGTDDEQALAYAQARLRSLNWRGMEAGALRCLAADLAARQRPAIVLGDFNDIANAVTTQIVQGAGAPLHERLYDVADGSGFTIVHEDASSTIDHILVSPHFAVQGVRYWNEHLQRPEPGASDHGQVMAQLRLLA